MIIFPLLHAQNYRHCLVRGDGSEIIFTALEGFPVTEKKEQLHDYEFKYIINVYLKVYEDRFKDIG